MFARWRSGDAAWPVTLTDEQVSLILGEKLLVIAGRQVVTAEHLEVLALLCHETIEDGQTLADTMAHISSTGAIALLPWGVGKWSGVRGQLVAEAASRHRVLLGDNADDRSAGCRRRFLGVTSCCPARIHCACRANSASWARTVLRSGSRSPAVARLRQLAPRCDYETKSAQLRPSGEPGWISAPTGGIATHEMTGFARDVDAALAKRYDVIIVVGGNYRITLTLEAARRRLKSLLVERHDFGGASLNSLDPPGRLALSPVSRSAAVFGIWRAVRLVHAALPAVVPGVAVSDAPLW